MPLDGKRTIYSDTHSKSSHIFLSLSLNTGEDIQNENGKNRGDAVVYSMACANFSRSV